MKPLRITFVMAAIGLTGCTGNAASTGPGGPHNALVPPAQTVSTGTPPPSSATSTASYTSAGAKLALPSAGGYTGTVALPASGVLGTATMTMTSNTAIPSGIPTILDRRRASADRRTLSSVIAPQFYETLNSSDTVVFNGYPTFAITAPATVSVGASAFYLATYDPTGTGTWTDLGRMTAYRQTLTSVVYASTLGLHGNVNYLYAMYSFPLEHPTSPFASASCPTPALAAVSSNEILWCAAGDGFEKISSGGSSFIYLPDVTYTVEGITLGPDGNVWFTAEPTTPTAGKAALIGKVDETSGTVTTYAVPNPTAYQNSIISYQAGSITAGPSSLYFVTNLLVGTTSLAYLETSNASGTVTNHVPLPYKIAQGNFTALTYGSDGNAWLAAETTNPDAPDEVTKISPSSGSATNYLAPECAEIPYPANLVQGGDGNFSIPAIDNFDGMAFHGICTITLAGLVTLTPVTPYAQPIFDLTRATDGSVWFADPKGVGRIADGAITQYADAGLHDVSAGVLALPNGMLWETGTFSSVRGVQVINPTSP